MKFLIVVFAVSLGAISSLVGAQTVPPGQYCPVASDFDIRPDVLYPGDFIAYYQTLPASYTAQRAAFVDETARVINLVGRAYITGVGIPPPNPLPGGFGPVTPGPYHLIVEFYYFDPQGVRQFCPTLDIPFTVGGSGAASATPVPSLNAWMLVALAGLLCGLGLATQLRRRRRNVTR
ncbi:MAG: hypothetical protein WBP11_12115 [Dokdonella sp.]